MPGDPRERNEALFREVNERIEDVSTMLERDEEMQFLCECDDPDCSRRSVRHEPSTRRSVR
jgi:hypothetical protein